MARVHVADHSFLLGAVVAALATTLGAGTALTGLLVYSFGANPNAAVDGTVNTRFLHNSADRPSTRDEALNRDVGTMLRMQERRNARLQQNQNEEADAEIVPHSSAPEQRSMFTPQEYESAYDICDGIGYTRSRLAYCIDSILRTGQFVQ